MAKRPRVLGQRSRAERGRSYDADRRRSKPWRSWYSLPVWQSIRADQLARQPLCERCLKRGAITAAIICNHVTPHRGIWELFIGGPFESTCKPCHDGEVQREERGAGHRRPEAGGGLKV